MKISIQGLVLFQVAVKAGQDWLRAFWNRISYKMILSKIQFEPSWATAVITILLIASFILTNQRRA